MWHNGRWATTQLSRFTLCGTTAAELLHYSIDLLCGTTAAELLHTKLSQIYFVWHNDHPATQLGRFTLWHNSRRAKQPGFIDACTRSRVHFPKTVTNHAENMKASSKVKFYSGCWTLWRIQQTTDKHRSICMLYEDKQQRWTPSTHINHNVS